MTCRLGTALIAIVGFAVVVSNPAGVIAQSEETPRLADGRPDLNGYWYRRIPPSPPVQRVGDSVILNPNARRDAATPGPATAYNPGLPKYKPELLDRVKHLKDNQVKEDRALRCEPPGVPRIGPPQRIVQTPREIAILYEDLNGNFFRIIPTDGRPHRRGIDPSAHGDSVAHWDGDTLVIVATNFTEDTWLGDNGLFHGSKLRVTERLRRTGSTMTWEATVEDPEVLTEPWHLPPRTLRLLTGVDIEEAAFCSDRDLSRMNDLTYHGNPR